MSDLAIVLAVVGGIAGNVVLIAGVVIPSVRWVDRKLDGRITEPVTALKTMVEEKFTGLEKKVDAVATVQTDHSAKLIEHGESIAFLKGVKEGREHPVGEVKL